MHNRRDEEGGTSKLKPTAECRAPIACSQYPHLLFLLQLLACIRVGGCGEDRFGLIWTGARICISRLDVYVRIFAQFRQITAESRLELLVIDCFLNAVFNLLQWC